MEEMKWYGPAAWSVLLWLAVEACENTRSLLKDPGEPGALAHAERKFLELLAEAPFRDMLKQVERWLFVAGEAELLGFEQGKIILRAVRGRPYGPDEWVELIEKILYARSHTSFFVSYVGEFPHYRIMDEVYREESTFRWRFLGYRAPCDNLLRRLLVRAKLWRSTAIKEGRF